MRWRVEINVGRDWKYVKRDVKKRTSVEGISRRVKVKRSLHLENGAACSSLIAIDCAWRKYEAKEEVNLTTMKGFDGVRRKQFYHSSIIWNDSNSTRKDIWPMIAIIRLYWKTTKRH